MMQILNGQDLSNIIKQDLKEKIKKLKIRNIIPSLAVILVGEDPASQIYVKNKNKMCEELGINSLLFTLPYDSTTEDVINLLEKLNKDNSINGILCQLPLPKHINEKEVINKINPIKDVDCFHPINIGELTIGTQKIAPCTPLGIIELIESTNVDVTGKNCVIIGRSNIVGKPISLLMLQKNATITVCHSKTQDLDKIIKQADILIVAIGLPKFITEDMVKDNCLIIDVGINRLSNGKICGDVNFDSFKNTSKDIIITPVPKGVGPMTITMLMKNTITLTEIQNKNK